jgi:hypothetical protein
MNGIVDKYVKFTITKDTTNEGLVLDKVSMLNGKENKDDQIGIGTTATVVTGYLILDKRGRIHQVQYWRIFEVIKDKIGTESIALGVVDSNDPPKRDLQGGYKRRA